MVAVVAGDGLGSHTSVSRSGWCRFDGEPLGDGGEGERTCLSLLALPVRGVGVPAGLEGVPQVHVDDGYPSVSWGPDDQHGLLLVGLPGEGDGDVLRPILTGARREVKRHTPAGRQSAKDGRGALLEQIHLLVGLHCVDEEFFRGHGIRDGWWYHTADSRRDESGGSRRAGT